MTLDLAAVAAPTDSESGDATHNPDVWELRRRITDLSAELGAAREVVKAAAALADVPPAEEDWIPLINALAIYDRVAADG